MLIEPTHIGVYLAKSVDPTNPKGEDHARTYKFYIGAKDRFKKIIRDEHGGCYKELKLIHVKKASPVLMWRMHNSMNRDVFSSAKIVEQGVIEYNVSGKIANVYHYYPKGESGGGVKGLGYLLEAICTKHLQKDGITHVIQGGSIRYPRQKQLEKVGLPLREEVPINEWLRKIFRGVHYAGLDLLEK